MDLSQIFRNIFGITDLRPPNHSVDGQQRRDPVGAPNGNEFRNPIWNADGDDDDDEDFRAPSRSFGFQVFTNPIEIHRFFEHQLEEIVKGFQNQMLGLPSSFGLPELEMPLDGKSNTGEDVGEGNLRDKFLKPDYKTMPRQTVPWFPREKQSDTDLDEKIKVGGLDSVFKGEPVTVSPSPNSGFQMRVLGRSVVTHTVRRPDGTTEHHRTVRDNQGNEETTVTRQIGDQQYTKTIQVDPSGVQKQTENFVNIDENNLSAFEQQWKNRFDKNGITESEKLIDGEDHKPHNWFPFHKFF